MKYSRRDFIKKSALAAGGVGLLGAGTFSFFQPEPKSLAIAGSLKEPSLNYGHLLREAFQQKISREERADVVILGGGVSGLSAGRWLKKQGINDFKILELEEVVGGNTRKGKIGDQACPWGAHYLPLPGREMPELIDFLSACKVVTGKDEKGNPVFAEEYLCFTPAERLYRNGYWQDGLIPQWGLAEKDLNEIDRFMEAIAALRYQKGSDGKYIFSLPVENASSDPSFTVLDEISMEDWLREQGYQSEYLHWYVDYCCRDDYGSNSKNTSAWSGLHYFCSRRYEGEQEGVLTWPEGNAWLVNHLSQTVEDNVVTGSLVFQVQRQGQDVAVDFLDVHSMKAHRIMAKQCIVALPQFVSAHLFRNLAPERMQLAQTFEYTPWLVANIVLKQEPFGHGRPLSWDNVIYGGKSLGYVYANHQQLEVVHQAPVITYYEPLSGMPAKQARQQLHDAGYQQLQASILQELNSAHAGIAQQIKQVDVWRWGHGMISPGPGFMNSQTRKKAGQCIGDRIHFAHTDLAGVSVFEEAFYQGIFSARKVLEGGAI